MLLRGGPHGGHRGRSRGAPAALLPDSRCLPGGPAAGDDALHVAERGCEDPARGMGDTCRRLPLAPRGDPRSLSAGADRGDLRQRGVAGAGSPYAPGRLASGHLKPGISWHLKPRIHSGTPSFEVDTGGPWWQTPTRKVGDRNGRTYRSPARADGTGCSNSRSALTTD